MGIVLFILCISLSIAVGICLLVAGCVLESLKTSKGSSWVLTVSIFYFLLPLPVKFIRRVNKILSFLKNDEELNVWAVQNKSTILKTILLSDFVLFFTTGIVISAFALPVVLVRAKVIKWGAVGLVTVGNIFIFASMLAFFNKQHKEDKQQENTIDKYDLVRYENADAAMTAMLKQKQTNGKK